jgi:opine dehydrogenase
MTEPVRRIAIVGAGAGGCAAAAHLGTLGFETRLFSRDERALALLREIGGIHYEGVLGEGFAPIALVTGDAREALAGAELVMLVSPAHRHESWVEAIAPHLTAGQVLFVSPGHTLLLIPRVLRRHGVRAPAFCETATLPYMCRRPEPTKVRILRVSRFMVFSAFPGREVERFTERVRGVYPTIQPHPSLLDTLFPYGNAIHHPPSTLCNAGRIEATGGKFHFYYDGITPSVGRLIDAVDRERCQVARALGAQAMPFVELFYTMGYTTEAAYRTGLAYEAFHQSEPDRWIAAPTTLEHRYFLEDIPYGIQPYSELGRLAGVPTPVIDSIIHLASTAMRRDFRAQGLTLERLGLGGVSRERMPTLLQEGFSD